MNTDIFDLCVPELIEQPNGKWKVRLSEEKNSWLSGAHYDPEARDWFYVSEAEARNAAQHWWLEQVKRHFHVKVTRQPRKKEPWWVADRVAGYKYND